MSERGVFAVDRGIFDHPLFEEERVFTRREAWLWLLSEAAWKPCRKRIGHAVIEIKRGQLSHSIRFIAAAWGWSKSRVDRFLDELRQEGMVGTTSGTGTGTGQLIITICKYSDYQRVSLPNGTASEPHRGTDAGQQRDKLEDIEDKEITPSGSNEPSGVSRTRGTRLPSDFLPDRDYARSKGLSEAEISREAEKFLNYWPAQPGQRGVKLDWQATWRTWVLKAVGDRRSTGPPGRRSMETLLREMSETQDDEPPRLALQH